MIGESTGLPAVRNAGAARLARVARARRIWVRLAAFAALLTAALVGAPALAFGPQLSVRFQPTDRVQLAIWVESADGTYMGTLALTHAVAKAGIGNRPGALQMNSGFRWPYGRREGVLPVWAHARVKSAPPFRRVIFQNRRSEGFASRTTDDQSRDDYYCLSFARDTTNRDALDAVSCASVFSSDKGRFIKDSDVGKGYAEPHEDASGDGYRSLSLTSLYPPRRDLSRCADASCFDHADVAQYNSHALSVMPELDAVTQATPQGHTPLTYRFSLPSTWPTTNDYVLFVEANTEGDYGAGLDDRSMPTPKTPADAWDVWSKEFGYAYRGQPSVVYRLPFRIDAPNDASVDAPLGCGALEGEDGDIHPLADRIVDDPATAPGSGADRLEQGIAPRLQLSVTRPNAELCANSQAAPAVQHLRVGRYPESTHAHTWATLTFETPDGARSIGAYEVMVRPEGGAWERAFTPDSAEELLPVALDMCRDLGDPTRNRCTAMKSGETLSVVIAGLQQSTHYEVQVTPVDDDCGSAGASASASFETPARVFSTVTPCFVATAAYGTPLAGEIAVLRGFRDRHLAASHVGRALIRAYYAVGPHLASAIAGRPSLRAAVRAGLKPVVALLTWWDGAR